MQQTELPFVETRLAERFTALGYERYVSSNAAVTYRVPDSLWRAGFLEIDSHQQKVVMMGQQLYPVELRNLFRGKSEFSFEEAEIIFNHIANFVSAHGLPEDCGALGLVLYARGAHWLGDSMYNFLECVEIATHSKSYRYAMDLVLHRIPIEDMRAAWDKRGFHLEHLRLLYPSQAK